MTPTGSTWADKLARCPTAAAVRDLMTDREYAVFLGAQGLTPEERAATAVRLAELEKRKRR